MPEYITTYGGTHFYVTAPQPQDVHIRDIAHALSLICRGNGHVKTFFSVGQHCIFCAREAEARGLGARMALICLLHDASECYMSDVPRPFKKSLPAYQTQEEQLLNVIYAKYLGALPTPQEQTLLKQIDDDLLYYDLRELLNEPQNGTPPELKFPISYEVLPFSYVEETYLRLFHRYSREVLG